MKTKTVIVVMALAAMAACSKSESKPEGTPAAAPAEQTTTTNANAAGGGSVDMKAAKEIYDSRCAACHGVNGKGDGPGASALNPKPRNYTDKAWQGGVTDEQIKKTIIMGGAAVGKSPIMPASPDLDEKPQVVEGLVKIVRQFGK